MKVFFIQRGFKREVKKGVKTFSDIDEVLFRKTGVGIGF